MKMNNRHILACALLAALAIGPASAQEMNYQGRLTDDQGNPLADAQYTLTFSLYDAATGGNLIWGPFTADGSTAAVGHGPLVELVDGRFNVAIGPEDADGDLLVDSFAGGDRYLQLRVDTNNPITPRQRMLHSPEAFNAATLGAGNRKVSITKTATLGTSNVAAASGFQLGTSPGNSTNNGRDGLLLETTAGTESGGIFVNGDTISMFTAGNRGLLNIYDEDDMDSSGNVPSPKFQINGSGGFTAKSASNIQGNLNVTGNITAGTITGTLSTPSISIPGNLNVDSGLLSTDVSADTVGINQTWNNVTLNVRAKGDEADFFQVENSSGADLFEVNDSRIGINRPINSIDVDGFSQLDGFNSDGNGTINGSLNVNRTGNFYAGVIKSTQTSVAQTFILRMTGATPGVNHNWDWNIDSNDPADPDLLLIYNGTGSAVCEPNSAGWRAWSDARLKEDVEELSDCLDCVMQLKPSKYSYKASTNGRNSIGFLAQEVADVMPDRVKEVQGKLTINYGEFGVLAVGAVKELKAELEVEKAKNAALETRLAAIEARLAEMD